MLIKMQKYRIKIKDNKIDNLAYMFREEIMDMTIKQEEKNILIRYGIQALAGEELQS